MKPELFKFFLSIRPFRLYDTLDFAFDFLWTHDILTF